VDSSPNVFLENLHSARKLETTYYTTDRKQLIDFFWYRESGIRVNIGVQNINVVPLYEDVYHQGDNDFVLANPNIGAEEKDKFRRVLATQCRYETITVHRENKSVAVAKKADRTEYDVRYKCRTEPATYNCKIISN